MNSDFFQTRIQTFSYFTFLLAASALGIKSNTVVEISVDYGTASDRTHIVANVWVRERAGATKCFICTVHVPLGKNEEDRIFAALNDNEEFQSYLIKFVEIIERQSAKS